MIVFRMYVLRQFISGSTPTGNPKYDLLPRENTDGCHDLNTHSRKAPCVPPSRKDSNAASLPRVLAYWRARCRMPRPAYCDFPGPSGFSRHVFTHQNIDVTHNPLYIPLPAEKVGFIRPHISLSHSSPPTNGNHPPLHCELVSGE